MSGHSKWSTIKRKKGVNDAKRGKLFTKLANDITIAARQGGGDISSNPSLRVAVEKAKSQNMPKKNVEKAIARGTGTLNGVSMVESSYEGYGPGGVAFYVFCLTDNKNRTVSEIKHAFSSYGGSMGSAGSVAYIFANGEPSFKVPLSDKELSTCGKLYEELSDLDDVVEVRHNCENLDV